MAGGLDELARDLHHAADAAPEEVRKVVFKGAMNIKRGWKRRWSDLSHVPRIEHSVQFDIEQTDSTVSATIHAGDGNQGKLATVIAFGTPTSAPHDAAGAELLEESGSFERHVAALGKDLLE